MLIENFGRIHIFAVCEDGSIYKVARFSKKTCCDEYEEWSHIGNGHGYRYYENIYEKGYIRGDYVKPIHECQLERWLQGHECDEVTMMLERMPTMMGKILSEKAFVFSPAQYIAIHQKLFAGIYKHAGKIRDYNITKAEWVLDGDTVMYGGASELRATLDYDFSVERNFSYKGLTMDQIIKHLAIFVSRLWQIHVFAEGNTRTTAVFFIKYLRTLGFDVTNDIFAVNAWYFRNALVRANYTNLQKGVHETTEYLELFLRNLLLEEKNELKNRSMHLGGSLDAPKCNSEKENCTLDCTLDELLVLNILKQNPKMTQKQLAQEIRKSERTVKTITISLEEKKRIERIGGKRFGYWKVNAN